VAQRHSSSRRSSTKSDGSESAAARGGARVCELGVLKIEGNRGSIYGPQASKTCGISSRSRMQVKFQLGSLISLDWEISSVMIWGKVFPGIGAQNSCCC
jgi:hypothetical protein